MRLAAPAVVALTIAGCCPAPITVTREGAPVLEACLDLAQTEAERREGLRGRPPLEAGEGLLIVIPVETEICTSNEGVQSALDVLFADADGAVTAVERAVPAGDASTRCHDRTARIVEMRAGELSEVQLGDRLVSP